MVNYYEKRQEYITEIEKLPYGEAVLVLPNSTLQNDVKLHHMIKCIGLDSLAMEINNAAGATRYELLTRPTQELIVQKILDEHKDELQYFRVLLSKPGLVKALGNFFTELSRCHVDNADELESVFEEWATNKQGLDADISLADVPKQKNYDIVLLYRAYLDYLKHYDLCDLAGQYGLAVENIEYADKLPYKKIFISDMPFLHQLQYDFIKKLQKKTDVVFEDAKDFDFKKELKDFVGQHHNVSFCKYANHRDEMLGTLAEVRKLLDKGVATDRIAIVVSNLRHYTGVSYFAKEYGVPVTMPNQVKLSLQPLFLNVLQHLDGYGTIQDFQEQVKNYVDSLQLEVTTGAKYCDGKISLAELQIHLQARDGILACTDEVVKSYTLSGLAKEKMSGIAYQNILRDVAAKKKLNIARGVMQGVTLTEQINAVGREYDYLFILGMNDGEFPSPVYDNWIYTDNERALLHSLGFELPLARQRFIDNQRTFLMLLQTAKQQVTFSWAEEDKPAQCIYCDELLRLNNADVEDKRGQVIPRAEQCNLSEEEILQRSTVDQKRLEGKAEYLGVLGGRKTSQTTIYPATALEGFAACPFSYLLGNVWQVKVNDDDEDELSPKDDGSLMHRTLEIYIKNYIDKYHNDEGYALFYSEIDEDKDNVKNLLQKEFADAFKVAYGELQQNVTEDVLKTLQVAKTKMWLDKWFANDFEIRWQNTETRFICVEKKFDNLELWPGNIRFKGRIDRIDAELTDDDKVKKLSVVDYKRNSVPNSKADLQVMIYQLAAPMFNQVPDLTDDAEITGSYYSIKEHRLKECQVNKKDFLELLKKYTKEIAYGDFNITNMRVCSAFCPYQTICRKQVTEGAETDGE